MVKASKTQLVDYIHNNFKRGGKKITKKELNSFSTDALMSIVSNNNCEQKLEEWINRPKLVKFMVDGIEDGKTFSWDCEYVSEEECRKAFEQRGVVVEKILPQKGNHRCKYCGGAAEGSDTNLLCEECRELFGHAFYYEL